MARRRKRPAKPIKDKESLFDMQDYLKDKNYRNYVLFILGISTGYRAGDLVRLKVRDVKEALEEGRFEIIENKKLNTRNIKKENVKPREVKIISKVNIMLKNYIKGKKDYEYLFSSRKGINSHISVSHVSRILKKAGEEFGLDHITAHSMRKTYAYKLYVDSDMNIGLVKEMLGHSSVEITKRYIGLDRETYDKYSDGLNDIIR